MTSMPSAPNIQALLQRAQAQTQANRYTYLRKDADRRLINKVLGK